MRISKRTGKPVRKYNGTVEGGKKKAQNLATVNNPVIPDNQKYINHMLEISKIAQKADTNDIESLKNCFIEYLELCAKNNMKVGNFGAYMAMGITKMTVYDWEHGRRRNETRDYANFVAFVKGMIATYRESAIAEGDINPIVGMFWQKSFDGLNEMTEVEASNMIDGVSTEVTDGKQIAEKYQDLLPE